MLPVRPIASRAISTVKSTSFRSAGYATISEDGHKYKVLVVGAGELFFVIQVPNLTKQPSHQ